MSGPRRPLRTVAGEWLRAFAAELAEQERETEAARTAEIAAQLAELYTRDPVVMEHVAALARHLGELPERLLRGLAHGAAPGHYTLERIRIERGQATDHESLRAGIERAHEHAAAPSSEPPRRAKRKRRKASGAAAVALRWP